jgi:flagellar hook-length control protein FliK
MSSLPITPPAARPGPAPRSAGPPGASGPGDFAALLTQTTARTAPAEGPKTRPASSEAHRRDGDHRVRSRDDDAAPGRDALRADATPAAAPARDERTADAAPQGVDDQAATAQDTAPPPPASDAAAAAGATAAAAATAPVADAAPGTGAPSSAAGAAGAPALTDAHAMAGVPAATNAAVADAAAGTAPAAGADAAATAATDGKLQIPAELLAAGGRHVRHLEGHGAAGDPAATPAPGTGAGAAAATPAAPTAGGAGTGAGGDATNAFTNGNPSNNAATPATPATPAVAAQPAAAPHGAAPVPSGTPQLTRASVVQTAERVHELVRIATTRAGNARATLQLRPESLGQVDVQLRTTRDGLVATIAAHDQAGLDALQSAGAELRRLLDAKGVELHSLDLQLGAGADGGFGAQADARQASSGRTGAASGYGLDDGADAAAEEELILTTAPSTAAGALVDVQA